jgi:alkylhydroperoxidase/carboxymuconolactone decarboxylase family protein YurZ
MAVWDYVSPRGRQAVVQVGGIVDRSLVDQCDPEFQKLYAEFVLNGMFAREVLPLGTRELLVISCLAGLYRTDELAAHIKWGLAHNTSEEVQEAILIAGLYGGLPCMMNGLKLLAEISS